MSKESLIIGIGTALAGGAGLWQRNWLLTETPKGRFLVEAVGPGPARWVIVGFFLVVVGLGVLLAGGWLAPIRW